MSSQSEALSVPCPKPYCDGSIALLPRVIVRGAALALIGITALSPIPSPRGMSACYRPSSHPEPAPPFQAASKNVDLAWFSNAGKGQEADAAKLIEGEAGLEYAKECRYLCSLGERNARIWRWHLRGYRTDSGISFERSVGDPGNLCVHRPAGQTSPLRKRSTTLLSGITG